MTITTPTYQLQMKLDLPDEEAGDSALSLEDIRIREETARKALESGESWPQEFLNLGKKVQPYWWERYVDLRVGRWPFRVAALIAWLGTPKKYRWPKTQNELANLLGMSSDRQFSEWRVKNPAIDAMVAEVWKHAAIGRLPDSLEAMFTVAAQEDYKGHHDRELHYKLAGILKERTEIDLNAAGGDLDDLKKNIPFGQLLRLAGIDTPEKVADFKAKIELERQNQLAAEKEAAANVE